ncbi:TfuA-like protein [Streptomyces sp. NPDC005408]|uniref:TfuA-like protein n=1 Tax=Streptomyces sp. NPDC005408 TaxID=3155341 RepID=UPI0033B581C1
MIHVYVGPTLAPDEPLLSALTVRVLPPVRHGDLFDHAIADHDTVVIIDGLYHQVPALRHKEILAVMSRGVRVIGAASIGALRAAELHGFGMVGVGQIFHAYVVGDIDGDDEVAVGQEPGGEQRALTWPLVNLRHVLRIAEQHGVVTSGTAARLLEELRAVYYPQRSTAAVLAVCRQCGAGAVGAWLEEQRSVDPHFGDLKRCDAVQALLVALDGRSQRPGEAETCWDTSYFRRWANHFATELVDGRTLATSHRVSYQALFDGQFPRVWEAHLNHLSHCTDDGRRGMPLAERMARLTGEQPSPLPAHAVFRLRADLRDADTVARLLARETAADRAAITRYETCNEQARRSVPGFVPEAVKDTVTRSTLLDLWRVAPDRVDDEAAARGFHSSAHAIEEMKQFMVGFLHDQEQAAAASEFANAQ